MVLLSRREDHRRLTAPIAGGTHLVREIVITVRVMRWLRFVARIKLEICACDQTRRTRTIAEKSGLFLVD
jgi:hypothetical protein